MRIVSPLQRPLWILALALLGIIAAQGTGQMIFARLGYLLMVLLGMTVLWALYAVSGIRIERDVLTPRVVVGDTIRERITITNLWPVPRSMVEVIDDSALPERMIGVVLDVGARQARQRVWRSRAVIRGVYALGPTVVVGSDPFGLFRIERRFVAHDRVLVHPRPRQVRLSAIGRSVMTGQRTSGRRTSDDAPLVVSVREYRPGDSFQRVHWRSTAKRGQLMLKESVNEPGVSAWIVIDANAAVQEWRGLSFMPGSMPIPDSTEEYAVAAAASVAQQWTAQGHAVGLVAHGLATLDIAPQRGLAQRLALFDGLAALRCGGNMPLTEVLGIHQFSAGHSLCVITSDTDLSWVNAVAMLKLQGVDVFVMLIEPLQFGGRRDMQAVRNALMQANIDYNRASFVQ
ncbi:MAG: hypothetical protein RI985_396 [Chloroflexota bacterium]|jgi:uncharacterized protein (DUF58 family)